MDQSNQGMNSPIRQGSVETADVRRKRAESLAMHLKDALNECKTKDGMHGTFSIPGDLDRPFGDPVFAWYKKL